MNKVSPVSEKRNFFKVREKSVNFVCGQGNLEFCSKSEKFHFGYFKVFLTLIFIEHLNKKTTVKFALKQGKVRDIFSIRCVATLMN